MDHRSQNATASCGSRTAPRTLAPSRSTSRRVVDCVAARGSMYPSTPLWSARNDSSSPSCGFLFFVKKPRMKLPNDTSAARAGLHLLDELGQDLEGVADYSEVGYLQDGGLVVLVDGNDLLRAL